MSSGDLFLGVAGVARRAGNVAGSGPLGRASRMRWARRSDDLSGEGVSFAGRGFVSLWSGGSIAQSRWAVGYSCAGSSGVAEADLGRAGRSTKRPSSGSEFKTTPIVPSAFGNLSSDFFAGTGRGLIQLPEEAHTCHTNR